MESEKIYEDSLKELDRIYKVLATDTFAINMSKLDGRTKQEMIEAISHVISNRKGAINAVITGVK